MSAYVIGDITVTDPETFAKYAAAVPASSGAFGCRYLTRGPGKCQIVEGDWLPERFVLAEYKDMETVKAWYYSPEYKELTKLRQSASTGTLVFAEGVEPHAQAREGGAPGYLIGDIEVTDPDTYAKYAAGVPETVALYGGTYLVRGVQGEVAEGSWTPKRLVVLEFESLERAKAWYDSPEYADLKKLRQSASKGNLIFADGS
ncbi:MAG: hypothetical protein BZY86_00090 [SAR202 cluster bacterium MP-NPac-SRR3961935-G1]|jgi:uncharacterized protein (DUF1330 family)|nr:MAG: hypothetical protein BZY85_02645 [SAR202 cluster bacterium MP-SAtl-SRR3965592-G1]PKB81447.1 MAG: hypothetical protein BZY84_06595 [SAR202 cluster bacterium MP-SInd-SRR3963457-G1]PKB85871.1 MAG: hypothetical protein BZY86_00090 [SAR202 cluster bacterium MP-NPac-SRR3961935-G1]